MPDLQKVTLNLFDGDFDRMRDLYPELGAGLAIRQLVRSHIDKVDSAVKREAAKLDVKL